MASLEINEIHDTEMGQPGVHITSPGFPNLPVSQNLVCIIRKYLGKTTFSGILRSLISVALEEAR